MNFSEAQEVLNRYGVISREKWCEFGSPKFLFYQVPTIIPIGIVTKMTSLPPGIKELLIKRNRDFHYKNQLAVLSNENAITSYSITIEDINAEDWFEAVSSEPLAEEVPVIGREFNRG